MCIRDRVIVSVVMALTVYAAPVVHLVNTPVSYTHLTSGTTGNPKGIFRKLVGVSPEEAALGLSGVLFLFSVQPRDDNVHIIGSPLYHTAVLRFGSASMHLGHTVVLMDKLSLIHI